ncbi:hypothetical protein EDD21DRAFT_390194, partial [Dissophora ornata]
MSHYNTMDVDTPSTAQDHTEMKAAINKLHASLDRLQGLLKLNKQKQACIVADHSHFAVRDSLTEEENMRKGELNTLLDATRTDKVQIEKQIEECEAALTNLEESLPSSPEDNVLKLVCHFLDYKKESLPLVPGRRIPMVTSLTLKSVPGLPEFPDLERVHRRASSSDMVFSFLRDFERRLRNATGSQEVFEMLCYAYLKKAILDHDVLVTFEKLMTPTKESCAWSWETSRTMFLQAVDQESAMGDVVRRLYSIAPRENEDYKSFVSRIRELLLQKASGDNHRDLIVRIVIVISNEGRAKVKDHFGDIKNIPSLDVNSPFGPRSSGYRPSPQIHHTAKLGGEHVYKRPRFEASNHGANYTTHSLMKNSRVNNSPEHSKNKFCHFCKKAGHDKENCFELLRRQGQRAPGAAAAGFSGISEQNVARSRSPINGFQKHANVNMVASAPQLKRSRNADDFEDSYDRGASGPGLLYEIGILDEDEAMNKIPDTDN